MVVCKKRYLLSNMAVLVCLCMLFLFKFGYSFEAQRGKICQRNMAGSRKRLPGTVGIFLRNSQPRCSKILGETCFFSFLSQLNVYLVFSVSNDHPEVVFVFFWGRFMNLPKFLRLLLTSQSQKKPLSPLGLQAVLGKIQDALIVPSNYMYSAWELGIINMPCDSLQELYQHG